MFKRKELEGFNLDQDVTTQRLLVELNVESLSKGSWGIRMTTLTFPALVNEPPKKTILQQKYLS